MIFEWKLLKYIAGFFQIEMKNVLDMIEQNWKIKITIDFYW